MPSAKTAIAKWGSSEKFRMAPAIGVHEIYMKENANVQVTWSGGSESARTLFLPTITRLAIGIYIYMYMCVHVYCTGVSSSRPSLLLFVVLVSPQPLLLQLFLLLLRRMTQRRARFPSVVDITRLFPFCLIASCSTAVASYQRLALVFWQPAT